MKQPKSRKTKMMNQKLMKKLWKPQIFQKEEALSEGETDEFRKKFLQFPERSRSWLRFPTFHLKDEWILEPHGSLYERCNPVM